MSSPGASRPRTAPRCTCRTGSTNTCTAPCSTLASTSHSACTHSQRAGGQPASIGSSTAWWCISFAVQRVPRSRGSRCRCGSSCAPSTSRVSTLAMHKSSSPASHTCPPLTHRVSATLVAARPISLRCRQTRRRPMPRRIRRHRPLPGGVAARISVPTRPMIAAHQMARRASARCQVTLSAAVA